MNLGLVDWLIVVVVLAVMVGGVLVSRLHMKSVADFLAAGRTAGRYLITVSQGMAALGAISIVGFLEQNYVAGFSLTWWGFTMAMVVLVVTVSGWVIYRFRQTRCLTLAEFFERRYSRRFRVFAGLVAFASGIVNFGIFPAVGARFFINFVGLPPSFPVLGLSISTFAFLMAALLSIALFFVFSGGQIAVIITDFIQGIFVNVVFVVVTVYLVAVVDWTQIFQALATAPAEASLVNPFKTSQVDDFNFWFFLIGVVIYVYGSMSWQGTQGYNTSASSAHEAKMGNALTNWRNLPQNLMLLVVPVVAYTVLHHPDFTLQADAVGRVLASEPNEALQNQLRVPTVLLTLLPKGLIGAFTAVMLAAFISTHDTYLHSWGSIFVQDVVMPFRKRPLTPSQHLAWLRVSITGVAVFIFFFSLLFQQSQYIFLFFAVTGAIFFGGSGAVLIGGLYWRRGTAAAAWSAMITGSTIAVGGIVVHQLVDGFPINGQVISGIAIGAATVVYLAVSLLGRRSVFDLDRLLHRGEYADPDQVSIEVHRGWKILGMGGEFTRGDRIIYLVTYGWTLAWTLIFLVGTVYNLTHDVADETWANFWKVFVYIQVAVSAVVVTWFAIGGVLDIRKMLKLLKTMTRDDNDDGVVRSP